MPGRWLLDQTGDGTRSDGAARADGTDGADGSRGPRAVLLAVEEWPGAASTELDELARLAQTDGLEVAARVTQVRAHPDPGSYVGTGKLAEVRERVQAEHADVVLVDDELTPGQQRTLEREVGVRVTDRTALILDIFAEHARSSEGRAQVELAQLAYQLPRLRGQGEALSRVGGGRVAGGAGIGVRGPGEQRLETERRRLRRRMGALRGQVAEMAGRRQRTRARRERNRVPSVAITGYTNAGKSSLLNALTGADALVQDQLFATLDPTVRRARLPDGTEATLTDTVGFVRHLPHQLVDAFRSTLEEVARADLVLHVVDASAPDAMAQVTAVRGVLYEIGAADLPELLALDKVDVAPPEWLDALRRAYPRAVPVSAVTGAGLPELRQAVAAALAGAGAGQEQAASPA